MDNSMATNINSGDNSMNSLSFLWSAIFKDGTHINQIEGGVEHRFQEVIDRFSDLKVFILHHKTRHDKFIVDLEDGIIYKNERVKYSTIDEKNNIRLIFFRRHRHELTSTMQEINHTVTYFLGYQYLDKNGNNRQTVLQIDSKGNWILGA